MPKMAAAAVVGEKSFHHLLVNLTLLKHLIYKTLTPLN
jgi:hypothetical protein